MARSAKAWKKLAYKYADEHPEIDLWPFQIDRMASDIAWRMEGLKIKPNSGQEAYEDWISGQNPYSPHTVHLDGEDLTEYLRRADIEKRNQIFSDAVDAGMELRLAEKFADTLYSPYYDKKNIKKEISDWFEGIFPESPYHVPFDDVNVQERKERKEFIRSQCPEFSKMIFEIRFGFKHSVESMKSLI